MITNFELFENKGDKFKIGDPVKRKTTNPVIKNKIFKITEIGTWDNYYLDDIGWHYDYQIRHLTKQEELEYQANKYNL